MAIITNWSQLTGTYRQSVWWNNTQCSIESSYISPYLVCHQSCIFHGICADQCVACNRSRTCTIRACPTYDIPGQNTTYYANWNYSWWEQSRSCCRISWASLYGVMSYELVYIYSMARRIITSVWKIINCFLRWYFWISHWFTEVYDTDSNKIMHWCLLDSIEL